MYAAVVGRAFLPHDLLQNLESLVRQGIGAESCDHPIDLGFVIARFFCTRGGD
jgi:hypothetical protein